MKYFNETYINRKFITRNEWADTYKAIHSTTEEKVILKVLVRKSKDEEYIKNLLKEVENLKNIDNPNLINVNNMFQYSGCGKTYYYIEGEYFKGTSLEEKLSDGKVEEKEALRIIESVSQGLKEFHDRNILFSNLNLGNIFINSKNIIKTDVLSYLEHREFVVLHSEGEEKVEEKRFNPEKDIYDLGTILYSLLTGKSTFESKNYKKQISNENLVSIIEKATNSSLENKYRNINRLILDLKSYLQYGELSNESYDLEEVKPTKKKRKKGKLGKALGVCASIIIVGGVAVYGYDLLEKSKKDEQANTTKIEETTKSEEEYKKVEENKEDKKDKEEKKTDKEKTPTSDKKDNQSIKKKPSTNNSNKNNTSNSTSNKNNSSSSSSNKDNSNNNSSTGSSSNGNSNNNTTKPSKPNKPTSKPTKPSKPDNKPNSNNGSENTTKPDGGNNNVQQTPEVAPPSNNNGSSSENTVPEAPNMEAENE